MFPWDLMIIWKKQQKCWFDVEDFSSVCLRGSVFPFMLKIAPFYRTSHCVIWYISARLHNAVSQKTVAITMNDWKHTPKISQIPFLFFFANSKLIRFGKNRRMEWKDVRVLSVLRDECVRHTPRGDCSGVGRRKYKHTDT
jgi:hypothetical protein